MSAPSRPSCPICHRPVSPPGDTARSFPFCSRTCKLADLGRWLDGSYRIPGPPLEHVPTDVAGIPYAGEDE